jgi:hypothetical protein
MLLQAPTWHTGGLAQSELSQHEAFARHAIVALHTRWLGGHAQCPASQNSPPAEQSELAQQLFAPPAMHLPLHADWPLGH